MIWKDRKYINPRKRVFKNMDTDEILKLEIQDDSDNIEEESTTPLNAHNLNQSQQDLLDNMSKTYTGTNITAPTVEGYGTIHKLYGHTIEEGSGEKSPSNPYTLRCVGDDVNLFNKSKEVKGQIITDTGATNNNANWTRGDYISIKNNEVITLSCENKVNGQFIIAEYDSSKTFIKNNSYDFRNTAADNKYTITTSGATAYIILCFRNDLNMTNIKLQKGSTVTPYSPYGKGTVEIISQNGDQQSSNIVSTKPLCCLKNGDNIIAQDWIDYDKGVVHRECFKLTLTGKETTWSGRQGTQTEGVDKFRAQLTINKILENQNLICNYYNFGSLLNDGTEVFSSNANTISLLKNSIQTSTIYFCLNYNEFKTIEEFKNFVTSKYERGNPIEILCALKNEEIGPLNCSNKIVQYANETTVSNRDGAEIEVSLTNNKAISEVNEDIGNLQEKQIQMRKYSTEEQVVGTWIDGKPLYRKVFKVTSDERLAFEDILSQNIDMAILCGGYVKGGGGSKNSIELGGFYRISVNIGGTMKFVSTAEGNTKIVEYSLIVIYTKTTD